MIQNVEVVIQCAHPWGHLLFFCAGQEADVLTDRNGDTGHDDLGIQLVLQGLHQTRGQCEQGLTRTRLTQQSNEVDLGIHQQIEHEVLLTVACGDAPDGVLGVGVIGERAQRSTGIVLRCYDSIERFLHALVLIDELVHQQIAAGRPLDVVEGMTFDHARHHVLAILLPEVRMQLQHAGVQQVGIFQHFVVEIVLCRQAQSTRLDAHVDVFADQSDFTFGMQSVQMADHAQDGVVGFAIS